MKELKTLCCSDLHRKTDNYDNYRTHYGRIILCVALIFIEQLVSTKTYNNNHHNRTNKNNKKIIIMTKISYYRTTV